jgi:acyl carrier protein
MTALQRVQRLMAERFGLPPAQLAAGRPLDELGIDSLAITEFMFELEQEFGVKVPYEETEVSTVGDIAAALERLATAQHAKMAG